MSENFENVENVREKAYEILENNLRYYDIGSVIRFFNT